MNKIKFLVLLVFIVMLSSCAKPDEGDDQTPNDNNVPNTVVPEEPFEVNENYEDLFNEANSGNIYALRLLYVLAYRYDNTVAEETLCNVDTSNIIPAIDSGDYKVYYYLKHTSNYCKEVLKEDYEYSEVIESVDISYYSDLVNNGDLEAFYFLSEEYEEIENEVHTKLSVINIDAIASTDETDTIWTLTKLALFYDNDSAYSELEDIVTSKDHQSMNSLFMNILLAEKYGVNYDVAKVTALFNGVAIDDLDSTRIVESEIDYYPILLSTLYKMGNEDALTELIELSETEYLISKTLVELINASNHDTLFPVLVLNAKSGNEYAYDYIVTVAEGNGTYKQDAINVLAELLNYGYYDSVHKLRYLDQNVLLENFNTDVLVQNIRNNVHFESSWDILMYLHKYHDNHNAEAALIEFAGEGDLTSMEYLKMEYQFQLPDEVFIDTLMTKFNDTNTTSIEFINFVLDFMDRLLLEYFDNDTPVDERYFDDTYAINVVDKYLSVVDSQESLYRLGMSYFNDYAIVVQVVVDQVNAGNTYAFRHLESINRHLNYDNFDAYNIDFTQLLNNVEAGDVESLKVVVIDSYYDSIIPEHLFGTIDVTVYKDIILNSDISVLPYINNLEISYTNPYARQVQTELSHEDLTQVLNRYLEHNDYSVINDIKHIYDNERITFKLNTMDMSALIANLESGSYSSLIFAEQLISRYDNPAFDTMIDSLDFTTMVTAFENGDIEVLKSLERYATHYENENAIAAISTMQVPSKEYLLTHYDGISVYDNLFIHQILYSMANDYGNTDAATRLVEMRETDKIIDLVINYESNGLYSVLYDLFITDYRLPLVYGVEFLIADNDLAKNVIFGMVLENDYYATNVLKSYINENYDVGIDMVRTAFGLHSTSAYNLLKELNDLGNVPSRNLDLIVENIENAGENWEEELFMLTEMAYEYDNVTVQEILATIDVSLGLQLDINDQNHSAAGVFRILAKCGNEAYIELVLDNLEIGNLESYEYLNPEMPTDTENFQRFLTFLEPRAIQGDQHAIAWLHAFAVEFDNQDASDIVIELINSNNHDVLIVLFLLGIEDYTTEINILLIDNNYIVLSALLEYYDIDHIEQYIVTFESLGIWE